MDEFVDGSFLDSVGFPGSDDSGELEQWIRADASGRFWDWNGGIL